MPVYHFTFHAYGTWLPDHPKGYARREKGVLPRDEAMGKRYREQMKDEPTAFSEKAQAVALQVLIDSQPMQHFTLYAVGAEASHLHVVVAWRDDREPLRVRSQIKTSMTRALNQALGRRKWFVKNAGQTPVRDEVHLHELVHCYLPSHGGLYWCRTPDRRDA